MKKQPTKKPGYALATILVLLGVILFAVGASISVSILESKISRSEQEGIRAYYVAEAGVNDALWRLNHIASYGTALQANTLNVTYSAVDVPVAGEGFTVLLQNTAAGAGYATIDVTSYSTNSTFTAKRHVTTNVFQGPSANPAGTVAVLAGQNVSINNGSGVVTVSGGDLYGGTGVTVNNATLNIASNYILTPSTYSTGGSYTVNKKGINSSNFPPAAPSQVVPGFSFGSYTATSGCTKYYTAAAFQTYLQSFSATKSVSFAGPVTCVDGGINFGNWAKNYTITFSGMVIITNGTLDSVSSATNLNILVNDPGNGKSGIFTQGKIHNIQGNWNINGVLYSSADIQLNSSPAMTVNGAIIAGTTITFNTGAPVNISYVATRVNGVGFTGGTASVVNIQHWEDQY